ncbi:dTDP-4-amino-4,6-dideoxygalactose transaminase [Oceanihabitans sediminis]|uniref:DegT/DnrJ/EryC1/StrS family aminotransferase n=1 Tax=Oceanihabitans sediminis TaxID=1812012 RepID=A0A368P325_9FLAO|nr:DegT/DnrJ/EryC1/StrS family aminotransferase [Oceanihabitans sediminis]MDX1774091.1 DegT/DnrJ/EryC1/StrS family aminotransferase [Oceanihabitans sediminis]RBP30868.1 dTDP-4-amino-4,6-dideoxygalactose transaminase [Oceanihabitans sediminis]RCU56833.1 DegT/DnrJ/EryC1/StrS family aminotransferase [Oceanihabitans sediminis]
MIHVTKTFLPDQKEYNAILKKAWDTSWITNRGDLVKKLENQIKEKYHIDHIIATTNGTLPLQLAIKGLGLRGEIITTPFSYIATASSIVWENCKPVFVDIDRETYNIDATKIEAAITEDTKAIIATHVFGNPCDVEAIEGIANKHGLKTIYDAAHAFGVEHKGKSIFSYGDISTCSFHATKIFHTGEGGALFANNETLHEHMYHLHNFGHNGPEAFHGLGINAKMSELQGAMGLTILPYIDQIIEKRKAAYAHYKELLKNTSLGFQKILENTKYNYSYIPVLFENEAQLLRVIEGLNHANIFPRRYFYPALNMVNYLQGQEMPIAESISKRILCLPLFYDLTKEQIETISIIIKEKLS